MRDGIRLVPVSADIGWSDIGTPSRLQAAYAMSSAQIELTEGAVEPTHAPAA